MLFEDDERYIVPSTYSSSFQMGADKFQHDLKIVLRTRLLSPSNSRRWYFRYATGGCAYVYARASVDGLTRKLEWDLGSGGCGTPKQKIRVLFLVRGTLLRLSTAGVILR